MLRLSTSRGVLRGLFENVPQLTLSILYVLFFNTESDVFISTIVLVTWIMSGLSIALTLSLNTILHCDQTIKQKPIIYQVMLNGFMENNDRKSIINKLGLRRLLAEEIAHCFRVL